MADFGAINQDTTRDVVSTASPECMGVYIRAFAGALTTAAAWPTTNRAIYIPFVLNQIFVAKMMAVFVGTASGNIDVGIYDSQKNRLVSKGSTAMSGSSVVQSFDITDTTLYPGVYYMAVAMDNTTGTIGRWAPALVTMAGGAGVLCQSSAFALPNPAVWVAALDLYVPDVAILGRTLV